MIYRFGDCTLDTDRRELRRADALCPLEPQVFDLLEYLVRNRDRMVGKDEILKAIWHGRIVSEAALSTRINAARHAIGDNGAEQRLIRTARSKGFRFVDAVHEERKASQARPPLLRDRQEPRLALLDRPGIGVLPFANIGGDPKREPIADGITENLITALAKTGWLFVVSRASSFAYKGCAAETAKIARRLGVRYVLQGSIRQAAGRTRIAVQLIDGLIDRHIWAEQYERDIVDIFAVEDEICDKVIAAIEPQLYVAEQIRAGGKTADNLNAWECIVRALALMNSREKPLAAAAHALLQRAISLDPQSAQAHALFSMTTTFRVHMGWTNRQHAVPRAIESARKALLLNADEPWAHAALGYALIWKEPQQAVVPCARAVELNPNFAVGYYFLALAAAYGGQYDYVFPNADKAEVLARRDLLARGYPGAHNNVRSTGSFALGQYRDGIDFARKAILDIPNSPTGYRALVMNLALAGEVEEAKRGLQTLKGLAPEISQDWIKQNAVWAADDAMKRYVEAFRAADLA